MVDRYRINMIVLDIIERCSLPQDIWIKRGFETLYRGSVTRIPKELLNETILNIHTIDFIKEIIVVIE